MESDIGLTVDCVPVLIHAGISPRARKVSRLRYAEIADRVPSLAGLYEACGAQFHLSLDMGTPGAAGTVVALAREHDAQHRLWLTYWRLPMLEEWRRRWPDVRLVYAGMPLRRSGARELLDRLRTAGVDALNVHWRLCRPWLLEEAQARGLLLFAWGVKNRDSLQRMRERGLDGVYCDDAAALGGLRHDCPAHVPG